MSQLASQLTILSSSVTSQGNTSRDSFLHYNEKGAVFDEELIKDAAYNGLLELSLIDSTLEQHGALITRAKKGVAVKVIAPKLRAFLLALSPYFLLKSAHKILEFLIRFYAIHKNHVDAVLAMVLPFHASPLFARMAQVLRIRDNAKWGFLTTVAQTGSPLTRETLVKQCIRSRGLIVFMAETATAQVKNGSSTGVKLFLTFYAVTLVEVVNRSTHKIDENFLLLILPHLITGIRSRKSVLFQYSCFMILSALSKRIPFQSQVIRELIAIIMDNLPGMQNGHVGNTEMYNTLLFLSSLFESQQLTTFPRKAFDVLVEYSNVVSTLQHLARNNDVSIFFKAVLNTLCTCHSTSQRSRMVLREIARDVSLSDDLVINTTRTLLSIAAGVAYGDSSDMADEEDNEVKGAIDATQDYEEIRTTVLVLQGKYPECVQRAIDAMLVASANNGDEALQARLIACLDAVFRDTTNQLTSDRSSTLLSCLGHGDAQVRLSGVTQVDELLQKASDDDVVIAQCENALLTRLGEENDATIMTALLTMKYIAANPAFAQAKFSYLISILQRFSEQLDMKQNTLNALSALQTVLSHTLDLVCATVEATRNDESLVSDWAAQLLPILLHHLPIPQDEPSKTEQQLNQAVLNGLVVVASDGKSSDAGMLAQATVKTVKKALSQLQKGKRFSVELDATFAGVLLAKPTLIPPLFTMMFAQPFGRQTLIDMLPLAVASKSKAAARLDFANVLLDAVDSQNLSSNAVQSVLKAVTTVMPSLQAAKLNLHEYFALVSRIYAASGFAQSLLTVILSSLITDTAQQVRFLIGLLNKEHDETSVALRCILSSVHTLTGILSDQKASSQIFTANADDSPDTASLTSLAPCLLAFLAHSSRSVRHATILCLEAFGAVCGVVKKKAGDFPASAWNELCSVLYSQRETFLDSDNLAPFMHATVGGAGDRLKSKSAQSLLECLVNEAARCYNVKLYALANQLLTLVHFTQCTLDYKSPLYQSLSAVLAEIVTVEAFPHYELVASVSKLVLSVPKSYDLLVEALQSPTRLVSGDRQYSIQLVAMECVTFELFAKFSSKQATKLLLVLTTDTANRETAVLDRRTTLVSDLPFPPSLFGPLLQFDAKSTSLAGVKGALDVIQLKLDKISFHDKALVKPLFDLLKSLNKAHSKLPQNDETASFICFLRQLCLMCLQRLTEYQTQGKTSGIISSKTIDMESVVTCITNSDDESVTAAKMRAEALLLLAALAPIAPTTVMERVLPVFSFLSSDASSKSLLFGADAFHFSLMTQIIETLLPPLVAEGLDTPALLKLFVSGLHKMHMPHRVPLMVTLVRSVLGPDADADEPNVDQLSPLPCVVRICAEAKQKVALDAAVTSGESDSDSEEEDMEDADMFHGNDLDYMLFCYHLLSEFDAVQQSQALLELAHNAGEQDGDDDEEENDTFENQVRATVFEFVSEHSASMEYLHALANTDTDEQDYIQKILVMCFQYTFVYAFSSTNEGEPSRVAAQDAYNNIADLITVAPFCQVISKLLHQHGIRVATMALTALNKRATAVAAQATEEEDEDEDMEDEDGGGISLDEVTCFVDVGKVLCSLLKKALGNTSGGSKRVKKSTGIDGAISTDEHCAYEQALLHSLDTLSSCFSHLPETRNAFLGFFPVLLIALGKQADISVPMSVQSSALMCVSSLVTGLGNHFLPMLNETTPRILGCLRSSLLASENSIEETKSSRKRGRDQREEPSAEEAEYLKLGAMTCIASLLTSVATGMLSPYLHLIVELVHSPVLLAQPSPEVREDEEGQEYRVVRGAQQDADGTSNSDVNNNPTAVIMMRVLELLRENVEPRLLFDVLFKAYPTLVENHNKISLLRFFHFLASVCHSLSSEVAATHANKLFKFYLLTFDLRQGLSRSLVDGDVDAVEDACIESFLALLLKLNEEKFRSYFLKLVEWAGLSRLIIMALNEADDNKESPDGKEEVRLLTRSLFFMRFVYRATVKLQSIFTNFYVYLVQYTRMFLSNAVSGDDHHESIRQQIYHLRGKICEYVLLSLALSFRVDREEVEADRENTSPFWDQEHFQAFTAVMLPQLSSFVKLTSTEDFQYFVEHTYIPCITEMAQSMESPDYWKPLNSGILGYFQHENWLVRHGAVSTLKALYMTCGHDYLTLLPETLPFIAEAMEDEHAQVELLTQGLIQEIETLSGEDLQSYLS